jgi:hypothetical protein
VKARRLVALTAVVGLGGGGLAIGVSAATSGAAAPPPRLQIDSVGCSQGVSGHRHFGSCTYLFTDGRRFGCPLSFGHRIQTPATIEGAKPCHPLRPLHIPRAWQRVFNRLYSVQACLAGHGIRTSGGPVLEGPRDRRTPIGELIMVRAHATAFIAFYTSARVARRAEPKVIRNVGRTGGVVHRRGLVTVAWTKPPSPGLRASTESCTF